VLGLKEGSSYGKGKAGKETYQGSKKRNTKQGAKHGIWSEYGG
jgi:hypothetical protein